MGLRESGDEVQVLATVERELFSDSFNYTGGLSDSGYDWTDGGTGADLTADGSSAGSNNLEALSWYEPSTALPSDHWMEVTFDTAPPYAGVSYYLSIYVRETLSGGNGYFARIYADKVTLQNNGGEPDHNPTTLYDQDQTSSDGDVYWLGVQGSTITLKKNGGTLWSGTDTDTPGGGFTGMYSWKNTSTQSKDPGRFASFRTGDFTTTGIELGNINGDNVIQEGDSQITVSGSQLDTVTSAKITGHGDVILTINSQSDTSMTCSAFDIRGNDYPFGTATFEITDGTTTKTQTVTLTTADSHAYTVGASIDAATGLAQSGGSNGDQWYWPLNVSSSSLQVDDDTNFTLDQPVPQNTEFTYHLYSGGTWDSGVVHIDQYDDDGGVEPPPADSPASWLSPIPSTNLTVGVAASGAVASYAEGTAPLSFSEILQQTPDELIARSDGTWSGYAPTTDEFRMQWRVSNAANPSGDESNLLTFNPAMPTLTNPASTGVSATGARITVTTPSVVGRIYWVTDPSINEPTPEQIEAGQNAEGNAAEIAGSFPITSSGQQPWQLIESARPGVKYYYWMVQVN